MSVLRMEQVTKRFGTLTALDRIGVEVKSGGKFLDLSAQTAPEKRLQFVFCWGGCCGRRRERPQSSAEMPGQMRWKFINE